MATGIGNKGQGIVGQWAIEQRAHLAREMEGRGTADVRGSLIRCVIGWIWRFVEL